MRLYENQSGLVHLVHGLYQSDRLSDLCIACNQSILVQNVQKQSFQTSERVLLLYIHHSRVHVGVWVQFHGTETIHTRLFRFLLGLILHPWSNASRIRSMRTRLWKRECSECKYSWYMSISLFESMVCLQ